MKTNLTFKPGHIINKKYEILEEMGVGYEGRVYRVSETQTGIERTIKFFYPERNPSNKTVKAVAKKLHRMRQSAILIQYHTQDTTTLPDGTEVTFLVSEFVEGVLLSDLIKSQPGQRLHPYQALHLLYALVKGLEKIHQLGEYHADIHTDNILVESVGLNFNLKLLDPFHWVGATKNDGQKDDITNCIEVFYECLGGKEKYASQPQIIKDICLGLKKPFILRKFKSMSKLRQYLEMLQW